MNTRQVSLLRGINVGGHNILPMARLRAIYESLDCEEVTTYLQSGNVVFRRKRSPAAVAAEVETAIHAEFGFAVRILGRTHGELKRIVAADPFPDADPSRRLVMFLDASLTPKTAGELAEVTSGKDVAILVGREFHLHCPDGIGNSKLPGLLSERRLGVTATGRNWRTVTSLLELSARQP